MFKRNVDFYFKLKYYISIRRRGGLIHSLLHRQTTRAQVAELVDANDSKSFGGNPMRVQFSPRAQIQKNLHK